MTTYLRSAATAVLALSLTATAAAAASKAEQKEEAEKAWASAVSIEAFDICTPDVATAEAFHARAAAAEWPEFKPVRGAPASVKKLDRRDRKSPSDVLRIDAQTGVALGAATANRTECRVDAPVIGAVAMAEHYGNAYGNETTWWARQAADGTVTKLSADERAPGLEAVVAGLAPQERMMTSSIGFDGKALVAETAIIEKTN